MIKKLSVRNFKSIKELDIDCRRINLLIGKPNVGKSNILEALGFLSWWGHGNTPLKEYVRFQYTENLFCDNLIDQTTAIAAMEDSLKNAERVIVMRMEMEPMGGKFRSGIWLDEDRGTVELNYSGDLQVSSNFPMCGLGFIKRYTYEKQKDFKDASSSVLAPPHGSNMFALVVGNKKLRTVMARFFRDFGFELVLRPNERTFEFQKRAEDEGISVVFSYPYILASDTLQRIIFYTIAIESNENSTLVFEEPESHAFPYYTGLLGERIALDKTNQYFISTHNPYFLLAILEKALKDDVNVFITYLRDYQTRAKCLNDEEVSKLMKYDPFFNLDSFIEGEEI